MFLQEAVNTVMNDSSATPATAPTVEQPIEEPSPPRRVSPPIDVFSASRSIEVGPSQPPPLIDMTSRSAQSLRGK